MPVWLLREHEGLRITGTSDPMVPRPLGVDRQLTSDGRQESHCAGPPA
ncbi:trehalase-like domain-containing protein [Saccharothrix longispora]|uniref:Trehalase-like N-terminal domain-containing protein n=1 Tax=Saccharothrix longispora TaxID=33920 RepID=A0ABU1PMV0_9PSEU|nr:hypothetical protein [Saccharothrix longispora]MDR6591771.1 hypothetical protein [Saccharothrix longispora]